MGKRIWLELKIAIALICVLVGGWWVIEWVKADVSYKAIEITAAHDVPENGLSVFAQFDVTQTIEVDEQFKATKLIVPIYWPEDSEWLLIELWQDGRLVHRWRQQPGKNGEVEKVVLGLDHYQWLGGDLSVYFNGKHIEYVDQSKAPRLFFESANEHFPYGNYRIAMNEKWGDIELVFEGHKPRYEMLWKDWQEKPLDLIAKTALGGAMVVLMLSLFFGGIPIDLRNKGDN